MAVDFILRNADGSVHLDLSNGITKYLGEKTITLETEGTYYYKPGKINVPEAKDGRIWFVVIPISEGTELVYDTSQIEIKGNAIYYTPKQDIKIIYGIY